MPKVNETPETVVETPEAPAAEAPKAKSNAKGKASKKAAKKKGTGKAADKAADKKDAKKAKDAKPAPVKKNGLRKAQERILKVLANAKGPMTRAEIAEKAPCDVAGCTEWIGSPDPVKREANDAKMGFKSLITLKYVKDAERQEEGKRKAHVYTIMAAGKKAADKLG
jgi:hypothetical protein